MPAAYPPEFRQRAVGLARERAKPIARIVDRAHGFLLRPAH